MDTKAIWEDYHQDIKRFIFSKVKDEQVADDLLQEVFIKVHTKIDQLADHSKLKSWLFTIAHNTTMDFFKRDTLVESMKEDRITVVAESNEDHSEQDCLPGIINHLPSKYKRPLYMADIKGVKQTDIAKKLKIPLSTIKSQIQRGRKLIVQGYMDCCDYQLNGKGKLVGERKERMECEMCS